MGTYNKLDRPIVVAEYDPQWPILFAVAREEIRGVCGASALDIQHIGSTSVPGQAAKPVIDIAIAVASLDYGRTLIPCLENLHYTYVPEYERELPGRLFLWRGTARVHTVHLHVTEPTSELWCKPIRFRDHLRREPEAREAYASLKCRLAVECGCDMNAYVNGKTAFVEGILAAD